MDNKESAESDKDPARIMPIGDDGRTVTVHGDGSATYIARANNGDCYWRVAADVLKSRTGTGPSDTAIANFVNLLAAHNKKADANLLAVGESIEIPAPMPE